MVKLPALVLEIATIKVTLLNVVILVVALLTCILIGTQLVNNVWLLMMVSATVNVLI